MAYHIAINETVDFTDEDCGPYLTRDDAEMFAEAEVGMPWKIVTTARCETCGHRWVPEVIDHCPVCLSTNIAI